MCCSRSRAAHLQANCASIGSCHVHLMLRLLCACSKDVQSAIASTAWPIRHPGHEQAQNLSMAHSTGMMCAHLASHLMSRMRMGPGLWPLRC